jgi:hypothetical protein
MNKTKFPKVWGTGRVEKNIALGKTGHLPSSASDDFTLKFINSQGFHK